MARFLVFALLAGCSFSIAPGATGDAPPGTVDASMLDGAADSAMVDAGPLGAWSAPQRITELTTAVGEDDPSLTADLLEIYFGSPRAGTLGNEDIWFATRTSVGDPFGTPVNIATLNSSSPESNIRISADGLSIYFASNRSPSLDFDLWTATRANRVSPWTAPTRISELATAVGDYAAHPSADGLQVTFCSNRAGGDEDLFVATRQAQGQPWGTAVQVTDTSTLSNECDPMDPDPTTIYFSSNRPGSMGAYDLYVATRTVGGTYVTATALTELNSTFNDRDVWVSPDQRLLVFSSNRMGSDDIYYSTR